MLGIIGGTGLYKLPGFEVKGEVNEPTPFGAPSAPLITGELDGREIIFLPRHGSKHQYLPSEINYRANIWALKNAGVRSIVGVSAVGSLIENIKPGDFAVPKQYIDLTKGRREASFFGNGLVAHIATSDPICPNLHSKITHSADILPDAEHSEAVYACVEGPRLGTRAESFYLKTIGATLVGMTNVPEAFLAREAQICYASIAIATDYDCWHDDENEHVTTAKVIERYSACLSEVQALVKRVAKDYEDFSECSCRRALKESIISEPENLSDEALSVYSVLIS